MFYVYELRDPRFNVPFFIGRGTGDSAYRHQRQVVNNKVLNPANQRIQDIIKAGMQVQIVILAEYQYEEDALDHEFFAVNTNPSYCLTWGEMTPLGALEQYRRRTVLLLHRLKVIRNKLPKLIDDPSETMIQRQAYLCTRIIKAKQLLKDADNRIKGIREEMRKDRVSKHVERRRQG